MSLITVVRLSYLLTTNENENTTNNIGGKPRIQK